MSQVSGEGRRFPTARVLMEAEAVLVSTERCQAGDRFLVGKNAEEATLGLDCDMAVVAKGVDGGGELLGLTGSVCAAARAFGLHFSPIYAVRASLSSACSG